MRSRVKSDEEYQKILEINEDTNKHARTVNDALAYFNKVNEEKKVENSNRSFSYVATVDEIKERVQNQESVNVEKLKEEIAQAQIIKEDHKYEDSYHNRTYSFEENARKLYENLRGNSLNNHVHKPSKPELVELEENEILLGSQPIFQENATYQDDIPTQEEIARGISNNNVILTNPLREQIASQPAVETVDPIEATDFTLQDKLFLKAINNAKNYNETIDNPIEEEVKHDEVIIENTNDLIMSELDSQLALLDESKDILVKPQEEVFSLLDNTPTEVVVEQEPLPPLSIDNDLFKVKKDEANESFASGIEKLSKTHDRKTDISDTLSIALDENSRISFSKDDIAALKNEEITNNKEKPKSKVLDILFSIVLVILIIVVGFLIAKTFLNF